MLGPDGLERPEAARGLNVADHPDADHGRGLQDGDRLHHLLLVHLGPGPVHLTHNVRHTSLDKDTIQIKIYIYIYIFIINLRYINVCVCV